MNKKTVLITGVAGLLGSRLADWLVENTEHKILGIDDLSGGYIDNVNKEVEFYKFDLANDSNVELRNLAVKAVESRIIRLSQDQRSFFWASNDRKLMTVPFDENPYSAFAAYLKTDEGVEVFKYIDKKLN